MVRREAEGYWLDPRPYIDVVHQISGDMPPGARAFMESPGHYDFYSAECVKDLVLSSVEQDADATVTVRFAANPWKHERDLVLTYRNVVALKLEPEDESVDSRGSVLLDELLPLHAGIEHEVALTAGLLRVTAQDVVAEWV